MKSDRDYYWFFSSVISSCCISLFTFRLSYQLIFRFCCFFLVSFSIYFSHSNWFFFIRCVFCFRFTHNWEKWNAKWLDSRCFFHLLFLVFLFNLYAPINCFFYVCGNRRGYVLRGYVSSSVSSTHMFGTEVGSCVHA